MKKYSCLYEDRQYSIDEVVAHIVAVRNEGYVAGICPSLREAIAHAPYVSEKQFVWAGLLLKMNPKTVQQQYRKTRRFWALMDLVDDGVATPEQVDELDNWKWQSASTKQI